MTKDQERLTIRINPENRTVDITSPDYQTYWEQQFVALRAEAAEEIARHIESGEIEVPAVPAGAPDDAPERAIRMMANDRAQHEMRRRGVLGAIGLLDLSKGEIDGQPAEWVDDETVPLYGYQIEEAA